MLSLSNQLLHSSVLTSHGTENQAGQGVGKIKIMSKKIEAVEIRHTYFNN